MKNQLLLLLFLVLFSCKSKQESTKKAIDTTKNTHTWQKLGANEPYVDKLNKFSESTEKYWFGNGRISSLWADPNDDNHLLAGVSFAGLYETFNQGKTWNYITKNTPTLDINKIVKLQDTLYISTGYKFKNPIRFSAIKKNFYGFGILKSFDNGKTWSKPSGNFYVLDFSISKNHNTVYAIDDKRVYKSINKANSFKKIADLSTHFTSKVELLTVVQHSNNPNIVYVTARKGTKKDTYLLFKSIDGGKTWQNKTDIISAYIKKMKGSIGHYIKDVSMFLSKNGILYAHFSVAHRFFNRNKEYIKVNSIVLKSNNFTNFELVSKQIVKSGTHYTPKIYEQNGILFLKDWYLKMKKPSDTEFKNIGIGKVHQDCRDVTVTKDGTIFYANDAGLVESKDNGKTWQNGFFELNANLIFEMGYYSDINSRLVAIGTQDCGYYLNDFDNQPYYPIEVHEGGIYISPHNKNRIYIKGRYINLYNAETKRKKNLKLNDGKPIHIMHRDGILMEDPNFKNRLYVSHNTELYVSDSLGKKGSWKNITPKKGLGRGASIAIPKSNSNIIYLANQSVTYPIKGKYESYIFKGYLLKSTNTGKDWQIISEEFTDLLTQKSIISTVITDDKNPNKVWFSLRNLEKGKKIFQSEDGGKTWQNISYDLPNVPANRLAFNKKTNVLYLANDFGVYYLKDKKWIRFGKNLPYTIVTSMVIDYQYNEMIISTFGNGVWHISL